MSTPLVQTVFVSYAWDSEDHKRWVRELADSLHRQPDIEVFFDQYDLYGGKDITHFIDNALSSDRIVIISTPRYVDKAQQRRGGVGYESSIISAALAENQAQDKFIPLLRSGDQLPLFLKSKVYIDARDNRPFLDLLLAAIRRKGAAQRPVKGGGDARLSGSSAASETIPHRPSVIRRLPKLQKLRYRLREPLDEIAEYQQVVQNLYAAGKWAFNIGVPYPDRLIEADDRLNERLRSFSKELHALADEIDDPFYTKEIHRIYRANLPEHELIAITRALHEAAKSVEGLKGLRDLAKNGAPIEVIQKSDLFQACVTALNSIVDAIADTEGRLR